MTRSIFIIHLFAVLFFVMKVMNNYSKLPKINNVQILWMTKLWKYSWWSVIVQFIKCHPDSNKCILLSMIFVTIVSALDDDMENGFWSNGWQRFGNKTKTWLATRHCLNIDLFFVFFGLQIHWLMTATNWRTQHTHTSKHVIDNDMEI